jgi:hypothetical protein
VNLNDTLYNITFDIALSEHLTNDSSRIAVIVVWWDDNADGFKPISLICSPSSELTLDVKAVGHCHDEVTSVLVLGKNNATSRTGFSSGTINDDTFAPGLQSRPGKVDIFNGFKEVFIGDELFF